MRSDFLELLICNRCGNNGLELSKSSVSSGEVLEGEICCRNCRSVFSVEDGIPEFLSDLPKEISDEINSSEGVATYCYPKEPDVYNDEWLLSLPYVKNEKVNNLDGWQRKISTFEQVLDDFPIGRGQKLLDIGLSTTWTTRFFAKKGYDCIALDIVKGNYRGLISSKVFFKHDNIFYECILAPMESMPLRNDSIDYIFSINSLHHSNNLKKVFLEIYRALKPGGSAYLLDDTVGFLRRKEKERAAEYARGVNKHNDHVYSLDEYRQAIAGANLRLKMNIPQRFLDKIGWLRYTPKGFLSIIYRLLSITLGMPFYFRVTKD